MKSVIMAGGMGTRLRPLTLNTPKPMVPMLNKPVMSYAVDLLKKHNIKDIAVTVQHLPEVIEEYFGDGRGFGVNLKYFKEVTPLGTAGSVRNASEFLDETFLVISGDGITDYNLTRAVEFHRNRGGIATLVMAKVQNPLEYGVVMCDKNDRIIRFLEKPGWSEVFSDTVNTGIYILEPEIFDYYDKDVFFDFSKDLFPLLLSKGNKMYGYTATGYWSDIGSIEQYRQTHYDILSGLVEINTNETRVEDGIWVGKNSFLEQGVEIQKPVFIGNNCRIGSDVRLGEYAIIGDNSCVGSNACLRRSIIWGNSSLSSGVILDGATVGNNTEVMRDSALLEGSVVGDNSVVGSRAVVKPGIIVWADKTVIDDTVLNTSLIFSKANRMSLFATLGVTGDANTEITPELASRLAVAFGSAIPPGKPVVIASDETRASVAIKKVMSAGLVSTGINIWDIGTSVTPVTRYAVKSLQAWGGIQIRVQGDSHDPKFILEFLDSNGINISKDFERKIENSINQEDFRRTGPESFGEIQTFPPMFEAYRDGILSTVDRDMIKRCRFRLLAAYDFSKLGWLIPSLIQKLDCRVTTVNFTDYPVKEITGMVSRGMIDLGVVFNNNADTITLFTPNGEVVESERLLSLWSYIVMDLAPGTEIGIPVNASSVIDKIAVEKGGRVIRTKCCPNSVMELYKEEVFQPLYDGVFILLKLLEYLESNHTDIDTLLSRIPKTYITRKEVYCPFFQKGAVMRQLIQVFREERVELIDGIKIHCNKGWALVMPDCERPFFSVVTEADSYEIAEELADFCAEKIEFCLSGKVESRA